MPRRTVRLSAALGVESALVNVVLKSLVKRERPVAEFERPLHLRVPLTTSFPSGHASAAFCAATLLSDGDRLAPLYYAAAVIAASSRIHVRIHHASDVVAGAALGLVPGTDVRRACGPSPADLAWVGRRECPPPLSRLEPT